MLYEPETVIVISKRAGAAPIPKGYTQVLVDRETPLGNRCKGSNRTESVNKHRHWLDKQCKSKTPTYKILRKLAKRISKGEKIALVCWCCPKICHADNLKRKILELRKEYENSHVV
jgi:hypothetical protein